ncbi:D-tyrosyl-tRNA(Tyr) deacylase [Myxococcota bacterium]|nr:D-tyrosyl-tRNA(Tyr) deacylase [Myxococcota bacterium]
MRAVVQRVLEANVEVEGACVARMARGLLVLVGVGLEDGPADAQRLARKLVGLRIFSDEAGRFDRSVVDVDGTIGLVSQFTLYGDARKGRRPSFSGAAPPERARPLFDAVVAEVSAAGVSVVTGRFGADMRVALVGDGPVTILLDTEEGL